MADKASSESICVGVRLRPFVGYEKNPQQKQCLTISGNVVSVVEDALSDAAHSSNVTVKDFAFDAAMDSMNPDNPNHCDQGKCYELMCQRMVGHITEGYHTCLFCYGQTGTGKTTTIMGDPKEEKEMGLLLRLLNDVFKEASKMREEGCDTLVRVQMLEVYNDKLNDLLHPSKDKKSHPEVRMNPVEGVYVKGSTPEAVDNFETVVRLIEYGNTMKTVAATAMNKQSSRGHTIFKLILDRKGGSEGRHISAEAFFVDLAGRENEKTTKVTGERMVELTFINLSLKFLADCIRNLGELAKHPARKSTGGKKQAVNMGVFRNSKLTMLLANALSGNSKTAMIGTVSPGALNFDESYSTLQFASTVKSIKVDAKPAAEVDKAILVKTLQLEVEALKEQLARTETDEVRDHIQQKMEDAQELFEEYKKEWDQKHAEAKLMMQRREEMTTKLGVCRWKLAVKKARTGAAGSQRAVIPSVVGLPHLTNFSEDPHLTGTLVLYPPEAGREYCGGSASDCDFVLPHGLGILNKTFYLKRSERGQLFIRATDVAASDVRRHTIGSGPSPAHGLTSTVEVNGKKVGSVPTEVKHQDCVVIGRSMVFYVISKQVESMPAVLHELHQKHEVEVINADKSREELMTAILGPERVGNRDQTDLARKYVQSLQNCNRDAEGKAMVSAFLERTVLAKRMVDEANEITRLVWPNRDIAFQLLTCGPALSFGFGSTRCPEIAVQLVQYLPLKRAQQRFKMGKVRRKSTIGQLSLLAQFTQEGESPFYAEVDDARTEVLFVWTFAKFTQRLQLMQEVREEKGEDPDYKIDPNADPWSEYGPSEVSQLRRESTMDLEAARDEADSLRTYVAQLERELEELRGGRRVAPPVGQTAQQAHESTALTATAPCIGNTTPRQPPGPFDGNWAHELDGERRVETIKGQLIRWQDGTEMALTVEDGENFFVELQGSIFRARLVQDRLEWDDGDVWTRTPPGNQQQTELVELIQTSNSNVEQLKRTQQQLIQTVTDGMHSLDDKLTKATVEVLSPRAGQQPMSPMTPVPSLASQVPSSGRGGTSFGYLGTTSASGSYYMYPPGTARPPAAPQGPAKPQATPAQAVASPRRTPPLAGAPALLPPSPTVCPGSPPGYPATPASPMRVSPPHYVWGASPPPTATPMSPARGPQRRAGDPVERLPTRALPTVALPQRPPAPDAAAAVVSPRGPPH